MEKHVSAKLVRLCAVVLALTAIDITVRGALPTRVEVTTDVKFTISRGQTQPFIAQVVIKTAGRIVVDVTSSPRVVDVAVLLRRPDGTVVSKISGKGGNLSLTYFATEREVKDSLSTGNLRWTVEISKAAEAAELTGTLKATHPS